MTNSISTLKKLRVVLARAQNPANIGLAVRTMKNFSVSKLILVNCAPIKNSEAYTTGWKGKKILDTAKQPADLKKALKKPCFSIGFTRRLRSARGTPVNLKDIVPQIIEAMNDQNVFLVFGNEKNGLSNEELSLCDVAVTIPANPLYPSLNLSHAVAIVLFEIFAQLNLFRSMFKKHERFYATDLEFRILMDHFLQTLKLLGYQEEKKKDLLNKVHQQIINFFKKSNLEKRELNLFEAFLFKIHKRILSK